MIEVARSIATYSAINGLIGAILGISANESIATYILVSITIYFIVASLDPELRGRVNLRYLDAFMIALLTMTIILKVTGIIS